MPMIVKICNCYNLMWAVDQKPDNQLEWPNKDNFLKIQVFYLVTHTILLCRDCNLFHKISLLLMSYKMVTTSGSHSSFASNHSLGCTTSIQCHTMSIKIFILWMKDYSKLSASIKF